MMIGTSNLNNTDGFSYFGSLRGYGQHLTAGPMKFIHLWKVVESVKSKSPLSREWGIEYDVHHLENQGTLMRYYHAPR